MKISEVFTGLFYFSAAQTKPTVMKKIATLFAAALLFLSACKKEEKLEPGVTKNYTDEEYAIIQAHLNLPEIPDDYTTVSTPHGTTKVKSDDLATLGRVLFYDKRLSANNTVSCASCHKQDKAFSDDVALSEGFEGKLTARNSLPLASVKSFPESYGGDFSGNLRFFWDERAASIFEQSFQTLQNEVEMGADLDELGEELLQEDFYQILFSKAFKPGDQISATNKILLALEEFINALSSDNSEFDQNLKAANSTLVPFAGFTEQENLGKNLYMLNCRSCHGHKMERTALRTANNGLDEVYADQGIGSLTGRPQDNGVFKVPMLRNVALTAPYMHDGRFATLEEVIEHYNSGIKNHPNLNQELSPDGEPKKLNLNDEEKQALVAFLHTLTDVSTISHSRFSNPFRE
ncbi:MAG: cytochrome c peroxidase [Bacteroidota bacterium]